MLVGDVLQLAGALRMDQFEWGVSFVSACNRRLEPHTTNSLPVIRVAMTGAEVRDCLYRLPVKEMTEFLLRDFDIGSQTLLPVVDMETTIKKRPVLTLKKTEPKKPTTVIVKTKNRSSMALLLGAVLVFLALLLAISMSSATVEAGALPNEASVKTIADIILDVVHAYFYPEQPPNTPQNVL